MAEVHILVAIFVVQFTLQIILHWANEINDGNH